MNKNISIRKSIAVIGTCFVIGTLVGRITSNENEIQDNNSTNIENNNYENTPKYDNTVNIITTAEDAENYELLKTNPTKDELINAINNNQSITDEYKVKTYFYNYINTLYEKYPELNKSILLKNIELLTVNYFNTEEMKEQSGSEYTNAYCNTFDHSLNLCTDKPIDQSIYHEISHLLRTINFSENDMVINIDFEDKLYGQALEEEITTVFTNDVMYNVSGYQVGNIYLLENLIGKDELYDIYFNEDIYSFIDKMDEINNDLSADSFVNYLDLQNSNYFDSDKLNDFQYDKELYNMYNEYFIKKQDRENFINIEEDLESYQTLIYNISTTDDIKDEVLDNLNTSVREKIYTK